MNSLSVVMVLASTLALGLSAHGHHSLAATYDANQEIRLEGRLIQFQFRNPHSFVHIEAPDENGNMQRWAVEWGGAGALERQGVTRTTLRVGDGVVITGSPSRQTGAHRVKMNTLLRLSDGFGWGTEPDEVVD
jgi:hypothetical protein